MTGWRPISEARCKVPFIVHHRTEFRIVELHHEKDSQIADIMPSGTVVEPRTGRIWTAEWFHPLPDLPPRKATS